MLLNDRTKGLAGVALLSALSVILLVMGTIISVNTLFFTALAAYLIGYSINKFGVRFGAMQLVVCLLLDFILNPDKIHWILYLSLGGYILLSEIIYRYFNKGEECKKKFHRQLIYNWILFNIIYVPLVLFFRTLISTSAWFSGVSGIFLLLGVGQFGWIVYDRAYREFFKLMRERRL